MITNSPAASQTIESLQSATRFQIGSIAAQSIAWQKKKLQHVRLCSKLGMHKTTRKMLQAWKKERECCKLMLAHVA